MANAIDASPEKSELIIDIDSNHDAIIVHIQDQGPGLPFTPEAGNLEPGPSTKRFGTGLGIPIAFKICQSHGWNLYFEVIENKGTHVLITVPKDK